MCLRVCARDMIFDAKRRLICICYNCASVYISRNDGCCYAFFVFFTLKRNHCILHFQDEPRKFMDSHFAVTLML